MQQNLEKVNWAIQSGMCITEVGEEKEEEGEGILIVRNQPLAQEVEGKN